MEYIFFERLKDSTAFRLLYTPIAVDIEQGVVNITFLASVLTGRVA